jgi:SAM-dependent methyltransferase
MPRDSARLGLQNSMLRSPSSHGDESAPRGEGEAGNWIDDYRNPYIDVVHREAIRQVVAKLANAPGKMLLDANCGDGRLTDRFAGFGYRVTAVCRRADQLEEARARLAQYPDAHVVLHQAQTGGQPFASATFDIVVAWGLLVHAVDPKDELSELVRLLAPGGFLVVCDNDCRSLDVMVLERALIAAKALLGKPRQRREINERGVEEWVTSPGEGGHAGQSLLVRKTDFRYLDRLLLAAGLSKVSETTSEYTELFTRLPARWMKRLVYSFNHGVLRTGLNVPGAFGKTAVYRKMA